MPRDPPNPPSGTTLSSLDRAFRIVESIEEAGRATPSEVAGRLDLPPSTVHPYLKTLAANGYLLNDGGAYRVGLKFLEHGGRARHRMDVYRAARRELADLAATTGMAVGLGVEERGLRVLVATAEGPEGVYDNPPLGQATEMHWSALGKAILSTLPEDRVDEIVELRGLPRATERTITSREALAAALETVRERGYATEREEREAGLHAIAAPIETREADPGCAVAVSGPKGAIERDEDALIDALRESGNVVKLRYDHY